MIEIIGTPKELTDFFEDVKEFTKSSSLQAFCDDAFSKIDNNLEIQKLKIGENPYKFYSFGRKLFRCD